MKQFFYTWLGWAAFISAVVTIIGETHRYISGDFVITRALFVWAIASLFLTVFWYLVQEKGE